MKNLLIVLLVLLAFALVIGVFASGGNFLSDQTDTEVSEEAPKYTYSKTRPESAEILYCTYDHGIADPSGNAASGWLSNEEEGYTMIGVSFSNLTPGNTYTLFFDISNDFIQYMVPKKYYLRTGGASSFTFAEVPTGTEDNPFGEGYVTFTAESTSVELFLLRLGYTSNESLIDAYHQDFLKASVFKLYGG